MTTLLRQLLPFKDIGWKEIGEEFTRFTLLKTAWGAVYLHRLYAPKPHSKCHDHPWSFVTVLLKGGYYEWACWKRYKNGAPLEHYWKWQRPGKIMYRPAAWRHNVVTEGVSWSLVFVGPKRRSWGFVEVCA